MIAPAVAFPLLLAFWVFVGWRVRVERGRVLSPMRAYVLAMRRMERAVGEAFAPIIVETARRAAAFARAFNASLDEAEAALARALELPDGYSVAYDTRDLLDPDPEGGTS